ncbi:hypothetical protein P7C70_g2971, partial [Phenoliferia sp. Uapishka_3]
MLATVSLLVLLAHFATSLPANTSASANDPQIEWVACADHLPVTLQGLVPNETLAALPSTLSCGTLRVAIDYSQAFSATNSFALGFAHYGTPDATGNLFFNPGGPGTEVASFAWMVALNVTNEFKGLETFNLTAMDIRGSFQSSQLSCSEALYGAIPQDFPTSQEEFDQLQAASRTWVDSCRNETGPLIDHLATTNVARDFENLRLTLGTGKVHYMGISYGTFYGAQWISDFPDALDRVVLDGVFAHGLNNSQLVGLGVKAANRELERADSYVLKLSLDRF